MDAVVVDCPGVVIILVEEDSGCGEAVVVFKIDCSEVWANGVVMAFVVVDDDDVVDGDAEVSEKL